MTLLSSQLLCLAVLILGALVAGLILLLRDLDVPPGFGDVTRCQERPNSPESARE